MAKKRRKLGLLWWTIYFLVMLAVSGGGGYYFWDSYRMVVESKEYFKPGIDPVANAAAKAASQAAYGEMFGGLTAFTSIAGMLFLAFTLWLQIAELSKSEKEQHDLAAQVADLARATRESGLAQRYFELQRYLDERRADRAMLFEAPEDVVKQQVMIEGSPMREAALRVGASFNLAGVLMNNNFVDPRLVIDAQSYAAPKAFGLLQEMLTDLRVVRSPNYFIHFDELVHGIAQAAAPQAQGDQA